jgi:hypothetical protein
MAEDLCSSIRGRYVSSKLRVYSGPWLILEVPAMVTCMGVYSCMDIKEVNDPTSTCNKVVALSAVAEWILSIGWVAYMSTIAYDLYHIGIVVEVWQLTGGSLVTKGCDSSDWEDQRTKQSLQLLLPHPPLSACN